MHRAKRRRYESEFKSNAIILAKEPDRSALSVEYSLGIPNGMLGKWHRHLVEKTTQSFR